MKKISFILIILILFTSCSPSLSDGFDKGTLEDKVALIIGYLKEKATDKLHEESTVALKEGLTEETMNAVYELLEEAGEFEEILKISTSSTTDKNSKEEFAVSVVKTKYSLKEITFTMSFTKQYKLAGLFLK
ncbi:MAG: DUF3887 domain-containing protein [Tissierellia bacterium]|nr:DUF3887 domain-containing protein [Tissierellia bacterium]